MQKTTAKLISITIMMIISLCLMTTATYAYLVLSKSPAISGIAVSIGGDNTIKLAENVTEVLESGEVVSYPGSFEGSMTFESPAQLQPLRPVSTSDGVNWYFPKYREEKLYKYTPGITDKGDNSLVDTNEFIHDSTLSYGNISAEVTTTTNGSYIYFDFWAVSPSQDCILRVSTGDNEGSYVISPPTVETTEDGGYTLNTSTDRAAAFTRVGFLVNTDVQTDSDALSAYVERPYYNEAHKKLRGVYREKGQDGNSAKRTNFAIYEPNADWHPDLLGSLVYTNTGIADDVVQDGDYVITNPLTKISNIHILGDVQHCVAVQKKSRWSETEGKLDIVKSFESFISFIGDKVKQFTPEELESKFYINWLNSSYEKYLETGKFITSTRSLYSAAEGKLGGLGYVPAEKMAALEESGATTDVNIVYLERNVPQRIRMYIYLEGQDVDCISSTEVSNLIVHIELAGSNQT